MPLPILIARNVIYCIRLATDRRLRAMRLCRSAGGGLLRGEQCPVARSPAAPPPPAMPRTSPRPTRGLGHKAIWPGSGCRDCGLVGSASRLAAGVDNPTRGVRATRTRQRAFACRLAKARCRLTRAAGPPLARSIFPLPGRSHHQGLGPCRLPSARRQRDDDGWWQGDICNRLAVAVPDLDRPTGGVQEE